MGGNLSSSDLSLLCSGSPGAPPCPYGRKCRPRRSPLPVLCSSEHLLAGYRCHSQAFPQPPPIPPPHPHAAFRSKHILESHLMAPSFPHQHPAPTQLLASAMKAGGEGTAPEMSRLPTLVGSGHALAMVLQLLLCPCPFCPIGSLQGSCQRRGVGEGYRGEVAPYLSVGASKARP